ncbi:hypothetical protein H5410_056043 [Solanum commersonii]|uniref:Uncharacterized protein n=1 Tax=Solanum commersonii TaxID=4109 RepID=A0A9J5WKJ4_SOLCO|nr:hypothetical protein H5410_056043 [Solanum commersonii]
MSGTQRSGKAVVSSSCKRVRTGTTIPPAPAVPRGQTPLYGVSAVTSEGKKLYKTHIETKYYSNVVIEDVAQHGGLAYTFSYQSSTGTTKALSDILTGLNISHLYQQIRHTLCVVQSTAKRPGVPEESVDYLAPLFIIPLDVTKRKRPENAHGPTLTTTERNKKDDMITARLFGLEMLCHRNGC